MCIRDRPKASMPNTPFPDFELPATSGATFKFSEQSGHPVVIYFYPKDNTPGCTAEGQQFRDLYPQFQQFKCAIFGVSRDSLKSHQSFKSKMSFPFELLSDADEQACRLFDVVKMKNIHVFHLDDIEQPARLLIGVGQQLEREAHFRFEALVGLQAVARHAENRAFELLELRVEIAELLAFGGAARSIVLGIEVDYDGMTALFGKLEGGAAGGWEFEVGKRC